MKHTSHIRLLCGRLVGPPTLAVAVLLAGVPGIPATAAASVANPDPALIARWEPCEPHTGVTVIVDDRKLAEGKIYVGCAAGEQVSGAEVLQHAGFQVEGTTTYGLDFICRIDGQPTPAEQSCTTTPGAGAYWSYWHGQPGGRWSYSGGGAAGYKPTLGSVEGWSFGGGEPPRIEPMDGAGSSKFTLPPTQESSVIPERLAREWLTSDIDGTAVLATELEAERSPESPGPEALLAGAVALARAGVAPARLGQLSDWLERTCEKEGRPIGSCVLSGFAEPSAPQSERYAARFALAVLGLHALGQNSESFAGTNLRGTLESMIEAGSGAVENGGSPSTALEVTAPTVLALADTGTLPAKALAAIDLILGSQNAGSGGFAGTLASETEAIQALAAAREQGAGLLGTERLTAIETALAKAGGYLESIQEPNGAFHGDQVSASALGAVGLALTGRNHAAAAQRAARWVSSYQVTAEYAGIGNAETGEHTPAEDVIGAFLEGEAALRGALAYGVSSDDHYGLYDAAQIPTIDALNALQIAGPYGPYDAAFDERSLFFEDRPVGSASEPLAATLTNEDVRPVTIATLQLAGDQSGDFKIVGGNCAGRTLAPGESCEVQVAFDPSALGLCETQLQATLQGTAQTIELPLDGTGIAAAKGPLPGQETSPQQQTPEQKPTGGSPASSQSTDATVRSSVLAWVSVGGKRLTLRFTAAGVATIELARQTGRGRHRHWLLAKRLIARAKQAGIVRIKLPRLAAGLYRVTVSPPGARSIVKTLIVTHAQR